MGADMIEENLIEYADPQIYDLENSAFEPDGPFLLEIAGRAGNPVLELGCGTGRLTIPMAQAGVEITGLDVVPGMLERARGKAAICPSNGPWQMPGPFSWTVPFG
jgi:2-polyprenyl-3-methyl-5-hydroxy-6-metoxy-1,4-benzoquinol methylase